MIRLLLGMLVAINIVLFLWIQYGVSQSETSSSVAKQTADFGGILLASEIAIPAEKPMEPKTVEPQSSIRSETAMESAQRVIVEDSKSTISSMPRYCGELGPVRSRNMAVGYRRTLLKIGASEARVEPRTGKEEVGYWTMIPEMPDTASAEAMLRKLQKAGLKDLWLMRKGEHKNAISLGLYTERRYAQRHANTIRKKGFSPVVVPKQKNTRVYWIVFSGVEKKGLQELENENIPAKMTLIKKVCKQALTTN
jgi:hypothetical protein